MANYVTLIRFTEQGAKAIAQTCQRAASFAARAEKMGVRVQASYWTLGNVDGVLVFEAPDDETATSAMLGLSALGNVHTQTLRAFDASEMTAILAKLSAPAGRGRKRG